MHGWIVLEFVSSQTIHTKIRIPTLDTMCKNVEQGFHFQIVSLIGHCTYSKIDLKAH